MSAPAAPTPVVPPVESGVASAGEAGRSAKPRTLRVLPAAAGALSSEAGKSPYPPAAPLPTQLGPKGIRFDFNQGCRVQLPKRESGSWRVRLRDMDTGNILFQIDRPEATISSTKRWYIRFRIEVWEIEEGVESSQPLLSHDLDLTGREVLIQFPIGTLGDTLGWFPYCARFADQHPECKVTVALSGLIIPLLRDAYPNLTLITHKEAVAQGIAERAYATYAVGLFFDDVACNQQPVDFRHVGLHRTAAYVLGVDPAEEPPRLALPDESRPIPERYVCIAVQASTAAKTWTNPTGWHEVIRFLKSHGYRVICIDQKSVHGQGLLWTHLPHGAEDQTGDRPLVERARWLRHADFFIGLSSGLAWLAWAARTPVVLISGFSLPSTEFATPYRIINWHVCNGCWNDPGQRFDHHNFLWCPRHLNTPRQFECTRLITPAHVIRVIRSVPAFQVQAGSSKPHSTSVDRPNAG